MQANTGGTVESRMGKRRGARRARLAWLLVMLAALGAASTLSAQPPVVAASAVVGPPAREMLRFGQAVAGREGVVAIGAPTEGDVGNEPGAVAMVRVARGARGVVTHAVVGLLRSPMRSPRPVDAVGNHFGAAVALGDGVVAVGADTASVGEVGSEVGSAGAVECFRETAEARRWTHEGTVLAPRPEAGAEFGCAIALARELLVVGARREDSDAAWDAGRVHLYARMGAVGGWEWVQSLDAPAREPSAWFGAAVAADSAWIAIGAPGEAGGAGAVHLFGRATNGRYALLATLRSPRPSAAAWFGAAIALQGSTLVVGEPGCAVEGVRSGAAWLYELALSAREPILLRAPTPSQGMAFGQSVAIDAQRVLVGAPGFDAVDPALPGDPAGGTIEDCGRAFLFERAERGAHGVPSQVLRAPTESPMALCGSSATLLTIPAADARFGVPAAVLGHLYLEEESLAPSPGAAVYELPTARTGPLDGAPPPGAVSSGCTTSPACASTGPPSRTR